MLLTTLLLAQQVGVEDINWFYWIGGAVVAVFLGYSTIRQIFLDVTGHARRQKEQAALDKEKEELKAWQKKVEERMGSFLPEGEIKDGQLDLGRQIAESQKLIKSHHDANESNYNALEQRVHTLEIDNRQLIRLPGQFNDLHTDHKLLTQKVDRVVDDIKELGKKQDNHHKELMDTITQGAFMQGKMSSSAGGGK